METYTILKVDKTINDVPLKNLTFQTGQTKWDGGSKKYIIKFVKKMGELYQGIYSHSDDIRLKDRIPSRKVESGER